MGPTRLSALALACLVLTSGAGRSLAAGTPEPASANAPGKYLFMWKAANPEGAVAYLVGSLPLVLPDLYPLPPAMEAAFDTAGTLIEEVDTTKIDREAMRKKVQGASSYPPDDSLAKHLSKSTYDLLTAFCKENGLPLATIDRLKPWVVSATLKAFIAHKAGLDAGRGIDLHFLLEANAKKMKVQELESADFQFNLLAGVPGQVQDLQLANTLKQAPRIAEIAAGLKEAWLAGDEAAVQKSFMLAFDGADDLALADAVKETVWMLVADRNAPMTSQIAASMAAGTPCFVVVGAAHLTGERGILQLLREKGCTVTQMQRE